MTRCIDGPDPGQIAIRVNGIGRGKISRHYGMNTSACWRAFWGQRYRLSSLEIGRCNRVEAEIVLPKKKTPFMDRYLNP